MLKIIRHLWLGVTLIAISSGILLLSDLDHRKGSSRKAAQDMPRIAVVQFVATPVLEMTTGGVLDELRACGYENGRTANIRRYDASGDYSTAKTIAGDVVHGSYDIIITIGTPMLQTMAAENRDGRTVHVFGAVTDPYGSGVGITGTEPGQHPAHLVGVGTFQPVEAAFEAARQMNPSLRRVGVVWCPAEHNSEVCLIKARSKCAELGIELVEACANNSSEVAEALRAVLSRDVQAVWIGGDTVAAAATKTIINVSRNANVPVFTNDPADVGAGVLFGLGAAYDEVGRITARMASNILQGADPRKMRVDNFVPERFAVNREVLNAFSADWSLPAALAARAAVQTRKPSTPEPGRMYKVGILHYAPHRFFDEAIEGIQTSLAKEGFVEGRNITYTIGHANGDASILHQLIANMQQEDLDMIVPISTLCLSAVAARVRDTPVVFTASTDPVGAGAGETFDNHLPNITGAVWPAPMEAGFTELLNLYPNCRRVGALFNPGESNARMEMDLAQRYLKARNVELVTRPINTPGEAMEAMNSLMGEDIDAFFLEGDNMTASVMPTIIEACRKAGVPILADDDSFMSNGTLLSCGISPFLNGCDAGVIAARVLCGENPASIPFKPSENAELSIDFATAEALGIKFPQDMIERARIFHNLRAKYGRPAKVVMIVQGDSPSLQNATDGFLHALERSALVRDKDFTFAVLNAHGEIANLPQLVDAALQMKPDLLVTNGTPPMQAAARRTGDTPMVFTVSSDPDLVGVSGEIAKGNITGVHDDPPIEALIDMARRNKPGLSSLGVIFNPSEVNSMISVERMRRICKENGIELVEAAASSVSELPEAAQLIVSSNAEALLNSADNVVSSGFSAVIKILGPASIPVFTADASLLAQGASGCVGDDYRAWGEQSGYMAARVLAGVPPSIIPIEGTGRSIVSEPAQASTRAAAILDRAEPWKLVMVAYNNTAFVEDSASGIRDGLKAAGLVEGRDFTLAYQNAQGDMATLSSIMGNVRTENPDLLLCISTPTLQAALKQVPQQRIVFTGVGNGVIAGAGTSSTDHMPNITGIETRSAFDGMAEVFRRVMPHARKVGTLFTPSEVNSVYYYNLMTESFKRFGIEVIGVPVAGSAETAECADILCTKGIDAVCQVLDNTTRPGFSHVATKAAERGLPTFCFEASQIPLGGAVALARDYYDAGRECAAVAVRVLRGESPADIPFTCASGERLILNTKMIGRLGLTIPADIQERARVDALPTVREQ